MTMVQIPHFDIHINVLNPFLWINCLDPASTSFLYHPWCFDIPIAFKPVFLNMNFTVENLAICDFLQHNTWNIDVFNLIFGYNWNSPIFEFGKVNHANANHWVWFPEPCGTKLSFNIYKFLNRTHGMNNQWCGWSNIWKLNVAPKAKNFIWLLMHDKIKTFEYLYRLNLGPPDPCIFYGLSLENIDHLFRTCRVSIGIWRLVDSLAETRNSPFALFEGGEWLDFQTIGNSKHVASIIAATLANLEKQV